MKLLLSKENKELWETAVDSRLQIEGTNWTNCGNTVEPTRTQIVQNYDSRILLYFCLLEKGYYLSDDRNDFPDHAPGRVTVITAGKSEKKRTKGGWRNKDETRFKQKQQNIIYKMHLLHTEMTVTD